MSVVVYRAHPGNDLVAAIRVLTEAGHHPEVVDRIDPILRHLAGAMVKVRIAVPDDEAEPAHAVIEKWKADTRVSSKPHIAEFHRDVRDALVVMAVAAGVTWIVSPGVRWGSFGIVAGAGFAALLVAGRLREWRRRRRDDA